MKRLHFPQVYEAYTNTDLTEGRGADVHIGYFFREADAKEVVKGRGVMGTEAYVRKLELDVRVYESLDEYYQAHQEGLRKRAWNKLSPEEREALGLKQP